MTDMSANGRTVREMVMENIIRISEMSIKDNGRMIIEMVKEN